MVAVAMVTIFVCWSDLFGGSTPVYAYCLSKTITWIGKCDQSVLWTEWIGRLCSFNASLVSLHSRVGQSVLSTYDVHTVCTYMYM